MSPTSFLFERKGLIKLSLNDLSMDRDRAFDELFEVAVEAGAEDVRFAVTEDGDQEGVIGFEVSQRWERCPGKERCSSLTI